MRVGIISRPYVYVPVSAGLLVFVLSRIPLDEVDRLLAGTRPDLLAVAVGLNLAVIALWTARSWLLLAYLGHRLSVVDVALLTVFANTVNNVTPASTGEIARAVLLEQRYGVPLPAGTAVILLERVVGLYLMLATTVAAWVVVLTAPSPVGVGVILLSALLVIFAPTASYRLGLRPLAAFGRLIGRTGGGGVRSRIARALIDVDERISTVITTPRPIVLFTATTLAIFSIYAIQFVLVAEAFGQSVGLVAAWAVQGSALVTGVVSAIPFGLGPAEGAITLLLPAVHVSTAMAGLIAIGFRAVSSVPITILGVGAYVLLSRGRSVGRRASDDASGGRG